MKKPQLVSQGSLNRMLQSAEKSWREKDFGKAIEILERASRLDPTNTTVLLQLGRVYGLNYEFAAAERALEKAIRVAPRKTEVLAAAGDQCRDFRGGSNLAEQYFQRALEQKDATPVILVKLAEYYERARRVEDASRLVDLALELDSTCAPALLTRARLDRQAGKLEQAEQYLRRILDKADRDTRARGWYELGGILDRQKHYDEAMAAFLEAKSIMRLDAAPLIRELKVIRNRMKVLRESVTADMLKRWFDSAPDLKPTRRLVLLGGHPRSGTTLLEQVLDSHPDIVSAEETEIFHDDAYIPLARGLSENSNVLPVLESVPTGTLQKSRDKYFRAIELSIGKPIDGRLLIDKNPSYTFLIPGFIRIFPEAKFLVALRDPRDVCLSCFMQPFVPLAQGNSAYLSLEGCAEEYAALMNMWMALAPLIKNPYLEVKYEDMVEDLESVSRRTLDFLGVPWDARVLRFDEHARQKAVRSPTYADVTKPVFKTAIGRWRNYQKYLEPYLDTLEPFAKAFGYE